MSIAVSCGGSIGVERQTVDNSEAAFVAMEQDLSGRMAELAAKSAQSSRYFPKFA